MADPRYKGGIKKIYTPSLVDQAVTDITDPTRYGWQVGPANDLGYPTWTKEGQTLFFFSGHGDTPAGWYQDCGNGQVTWYETTVIAQVDAFLFGSLEEEPVTDAPKKPRPMPRPAGLTSRCEAHQWGEQDGNRILVRCKHEAARVLTLDGDQYAYRKKLCYVHYFKTLQEIKAGISLLEVLDDQDVPEAR